MSESPKMMDINPEIGEANTALDVLSTAAPITGEARGACLIYRAHTIRCLALHDSGARRRSWVEGA
jgi:hypothetical protein